MGKNKSSKSFQGKEAFQRMNFLFQASEFLTSRLHQPSLAAYYGSQMTSICKKSVLRMEPRVKRQLCKGCRAPLVPGVSSRLRLNSRSKSILTTCLQCGTIKCFPMKPGYRVWVETPEACIETLTTRVKDQTESTKLERKENQCTEQKFSKELSTAITGKEITSGKEIKNLAEGIDIKGSDGKLCDQKTELIVTAKESNVQVSLDKELPCPKEKSSMKIIVSDTLINPNVSQSKDLV